MRRRPSIPTAWPRRRRRLRSGARAFRRRRFVPPIVLGPGDEASLTLFKSARSGIGFCVAGPPQRLSFVDVRDLVEAIVLMTEDRRPGSRLYFVGHSRTMDVGELWRGLALAVENRVTVVPLPRWALYVAMCVSTLTARIFGFRNQLDAKQYKQMTAPAFVCSSEAMKRDLGWVARYDLAECLAHAAEGYRHDRLLAPPRS